ncbi:hypothetical protein AYI68_g5891 [Smittium mucronatum]|uniref:Uncharacterized protein n=1 Tax=Smittium mucronatum TaxID=133383 RepID=A0A1R0GT06_9FUNG|nr:hypothetical protein AYI68_g5891 [Smittium mucronatum]
MAYKTQFRPYELLDVVQNVYVPSEICEPLVKNHSHFTTFIPDKKTGKLLFRDGLHDVLSIKPGMDISRLSKRDRENIDDKIIHINGQEIPAHLIYSYFPIEEPLGMIYSGIGEDLFSRIDFHL